MARSIPDAAVKLIQGFEGLHDRIGPDLLKAYLCPAGVWTIGWGSTTIRGMPVMPGSRCTITEAEKQFREDLKSAARTVEKLVKVELTDAQFGALTSFVQNVGSGAFARSTLLKRLNAKESVTRAIEEELPRWVKGDGGKVLDGLVRRRQAEVALLDSDSSGASSSAKAMIRFSDAAKYDIGLARQNDAWRYLYGAAPVEAWDAFQVKVPDAVITEFARRFRSGSTQPATSVIQQENTRILDVPYYSQRDNYRDRDRTCFSSTNAMALKFLRPSAIDEDDDYIRTVFSIGDTTIASVQIQALAKYSIKAVFRQDAVFDDVRAQINKGIPVPFGWLHRGHVGKPQGGGHWALAIGYTPTGLVVHDPWGESDLISGSTTSSRGASLHYSYKNLGPRWMVHGNDGWCLMLRPQ